MTLTATDTAPAADHAPNPQPPTAAIAVGTLNSWIGRPLHYAPGPAETALLLHRLIMLRTKARTRQADADEQLLAQHPAGWIELGAVARGGGRQARRAPSPAGTCLCHDDDGTPRPSLAPVRPAPLGSDSELDPSIRHMFVIHRDGLLVAARNPALPEPEFDQVGFAEWTKYPDFTGVDTAAAKAVASTENERAANVLTWLAEALGPTAFDGFGFSMLDALLVALHRYRSDTKAQARAMTALAQAAGVPETGLRDHLGRLSHGHQLALLNDTAHHLTS